MNEIKLMYEDFEGNGINPSSSNVIQFNIPLGIETLDLIASRFFLELSENNIENKVEVVYLDYENVCLSIIFKNIKNENFSIIFVFRLLYKDQDLSFSNKRLNPKVDYVKRILGAIKPICVDKKVQSLDNLLVLCFNIFYMVFRKQ